MRSSICKALLAALMTLGLAAGVHAQAGSATATAGGPATNTAGAAPEAKPDDTNAQRARSQPGNNAPFWRSVHESGNAPGVTTLPGAEKGVLIQPVTQYPGSRRTTAGEAWRQVRNQWIIPYGGALVIIALLAVSIYYFTRGPIGLHEPLTGRVIERFTPFERATHWSAAISFTVLAISGVVIAFGKFLLLPIIGGALFGWLTYVLKTAHNFFGPLFAVAAVMMFFMWLRDNLPQRGDLSWLMKGGGMLGGGEPPSNRYNAGEKIVFWGGLLVLGTIVIGSGLVLDKLLPDLQYLRSDMQLAHMVHATASMFMIAMFIGHAYLGTIGMGGAYHAMRTGYVDETWAREHHRYWYEDIRDGKIPAERSAKPPHVVEQRRPA
ncbi:MAG TPA: formate dehydrogenase subunit gamma [Caldimonas sp.]|nr:formate dehydrogenase subunit gamma [Caldimonas sp.]